MKDTNDPGYGEMSIEELEALLRERQEQKEALRDEMRAITAALEAKRAAEGKVAKLAELFPGDPEAQAHFAQMLGVQGIASGEALAG